MIRVPKNSSRLPAVEHLSDEEYHLFLKVYADHNRSMGLKERVGHNLGDIVKVDVNTSKNCLNVYYKNGNWWKYHSDGTWS